MQVYRKAKIGREFKGLGKDRIADVVALRMRGKLAEPDEPVVMRAVDLRQRRIATGRRIESREGAKPVRVRTHTLRIKTILPLAGFRPLPIPPLKHGVRDARRIH